jgi:kinetochore-associated protein 1
LLPLQIKFLQNWLAFADATSNSIDENGGDVNETVYEDFMGNGAAAATQEDTNVSDENVVRAYYILSSWNKEEAMDFLASEINSNVINAENQMQLYECFAKLVNETCEGYLEVVNPENYLVIRVCHYLKLLGINLRSEKFLESDKVELLKKIWTNHSNNPKGLEVMALICLSYDVHMPQIWNGILKQMVVHKMVRSI